MKVLAVFLISLIAGCYGQVTVDISKFVNQTVLIGTSGNFTCTVTGTQTALQPLVFSTVDSVGTVTALTSDNTVLDPTTYSVTGKYSLVITSVALANEGGYQCAITSLGVTQTAYLIAGDAPSTTNLYWDNNSATVQQGVASNLTCEASSSRPPASFRWFRGSTQVTTGIINTSTPDANANGYGTATSIIPMTVAAADIGVNYTCIVDVGDLQVESMVLTVDSGAGSVLASVSLVFAALFAALHM